MIFWIIFGVILALVIISSIKRSTPNYELIVKTIKEKEPLFNTIDSINKWTLVIAIISGILAFLFFLQSTFSYVSNIFGLGDINDTYVMMLIVVLLGFLMILGAVIYLIRTIYFSRLFKKYRDKYN